VHDAFLKLLVLVRIACHPAVQLQLIDVESHHSNSLGDAQLGLECSLSHYITSHAYYDDKFSHHKYNEHDQSCQLSNVSAFITTEAIT
jgi:hypothetical protein